MQRRMLLFYICYPVTLVSRCRLPKLARVFIEKQSSVFLKEVLWTDHEEILHMSHKFSVLSRRKTVSTFEMNLGISMEPLSVCYAKYFCSMRPDAHCSARR